MWEGRGESGRTRELRRGIPGGVPFYTVTLGDLWGILGIHLGQKQVGLLAEGVGDADEVLLELLRT